MLKCLASILGLFVATGSLAQSPVDQPCQFSVSKTIAYTSPSAEDLLIVGIGAGPCYKAELSITVTSSNGRVVYKYAANFKKHTATQWDEPSLAIEAKEFVQELASSVVVAKEDRPQPKRQAEAQDAEPFYVASPKIFRRLSRKGQPILHHPTYYEGGQYIMFDPVARKSVVVAAWGL